MTVPAHQPRYLEVHALQTVPYSNLNRGAFGEPKDCMFGGVRRSRVSSQAWKRVIREVVQDALGDPAMRTRRIGLAVTSTLIEAGWPVDVATEAGQQVIASAAMKGHEKQVGSTAAMLYLPVSALGKLAALAERHRPAIEQSAAAGKKKKDPVLPYDEVTDLLVSTNDTVRLFGRMLAEMPDGRVDAAVQVSHAYTTHGTEPEDDFFTTLDDWFVDGEAAGAHMDTALYTSGVYYRNGVVNVTHLIDQLGGDVDHALDLASLFLSAFVQTVPQAKSSSTAPNTYPDFVHVALRAGRPLSLSGAFEQPVTAKGGGYAVNSRRQLSDYAVRINRLVEVPPESQDGPRRYLRLVEASTTAAGYATVADEQLPGFGVRNDSYAELIDSIVAAAATDIADDASRQ